MILRRVRAWDPGRPLGRIFFFRFFRSLSWLVLTLIYRLRVLHPERVPRQGGLLVVANHQSHLDPPAIGVVLRGRHIVSIARQGLFRNFLFGWFLRMVNCIPINEKEGDAVALRQAIKELQRGRCILIFPEGSRTLDGNLQPFKRGAWLMVSRARCTVLPAAVEGMFAAWPRSRLLPRFWGQRAIVAFGEPVEFEHLHALGPDAGLALLKERIAELRQEAAGVLTHQHP